MSLMNNLVNELYFSNLEIWSNLQFIRLYVCPFFFQINIGNKSKFPFNRMFYASRCYFPSCHNHHHLPGAKQIQLSSTVLNLGNIKIKLPDFNHLKWKCFQIYTVACYRHIYMHHICVSRIDICAIIYIYKPDSNIY